MAKAGTVLLDSSCAVALCLADHANHEAAFVAVGTRQVGLAGHAWFETFSVLSRLPAPQRRPVHEVTALLERNFPATVFPDERAQRAFSRELSHLQVAGGSIYDGLVAMTAREAKLPLLTNDRRALGTYAQLGVQLEFLDESWSAVP